MMNRHSKLALAAALFLCAVGAQAQQMMAQVISVEQVSRQVVQNQWVCPQQREAREPSAGYAVAGGLAGGLAGAQVGKGRGREVAALAGAALGAVAADRYARQDAQEDERVQGQGRGCGYARVARMAPTGAYKALVDVDGIAYEWVTRQALAPGDLVPVDMRALRQAL